MLFRSFQVLLQTGLLLADPRTGAARASLAHNTSGRFVDRWVGLRALPGRCVFLHGLDRFELPVAHGEGRFTSSRKGRVAELVSSGRTPFRYVRSDGSDATGFPDNPNGADQAVAGVCNEQGNVLALMPHPERAVVLGQVSRGIGGDWGAARDHALATRDGHADDDGPGMALFRGLARHLGVS